MTQISEKLIGRKFVEAHKSLRIFVCNEINTKGAGNRSQIVSALSDLLANYGEAREQAATEIVANIMAELKAQAVRNVSPTKAEKILKDQEERLLNEKKERETEDARIEQEHCAIGAAMNKKTNKQLEAIINDDSKFAAVVAYMPKREHRQVRKGIYHILNEREKNVQFAEEQKKLRQNAIKIRGFDRIVMALDAVQVGDKLLGDCTGADLLREANRLETLANEVTAQSVFYRQLAAITGKTKTVRDRTNDRAGIVALLNSRFQEEHAA